MDEIFQQSIQNWYAVRVMPRHEKSVSYLLDAKGYEQLVPLYKARHQWSGRVKELDLPLFPGYVFCLLDPAKRVPVLNTPGVIDFVKFGRELPCVDPDEIVAIRELMSSGVSCMPWPHLVVGQSVKVHAGPLAGLNGIVIEVRKIPRLVLSVGLLNRSVLVEVDRDWITPERPESLARPVSPLLIKQPHSFVSGSLR